VGVQSSGENKLTVLSNREALDSINAYEKELESDNEGELLSKIYAYGGAVVSILGEYVNEDSVRGGGKLFSKVATVINIARTADEVGEGDRGDHKTVHTLLHIIAIVF
jgi:hypothetical protein